MINDLKIRENSLFTVTVSKVMTFKSLCGELSTMFLLPIGNVDECGS